MNMHNNEEAPYINSESNSKLRQYLAAYLATLSAVAVGACLGWSSPTMPLLEDELHLLTSSQSAWVGSFINIGGFIGALPAGYIVTNVGRKRTLMLINVPLIISWALICICITTADTSWASIVLYIARLIGGIASGIISVASSMYVSEIAENSIRGSLGTFYQLQVTVGILYAYVVGITENPLGISILCAIIPFIFIATFMFMPESPAYFLSKNQNEEAKRSLQWLRGADYDVQYELKHMEDMLNQSKQDQTRIMDIVSDFVIIKALFIVLSLMVFQQFCGVNAVIFYTAAIFKSAGSSLPANYASIIIGFVQVVATYCSSLLIEKAGRRILLIVSDLVMAICLALLGAYFHLQSIHVDVSSWSFLPLVSLAVFIIVFSLGYGPIPWIIMGELVPTNLKGFSSALAACTSWLLAFVVTNNFASLVETIGEGETFWVFSIISVLGTIVVAALLPETKGKDIQEIMEALGKKPSNNEFSTKASDFK